MVDSVGQGVDAVDPRVAQRLDRPVRLTPVQRDRVARDARRRSLLVRPETNLLRMGRGLPLVQPPVPLLRSRLPRRCVVKPKVHGQALGVARAVSGRVLEVNAHDPVADRRAQTVHARDARPGDARVEARASRGRADLDVRGDDRRDLALRVAPGDGEAVLGAPALAALHVDVRHRRRGMVVDQDRALDRGLVARGVRADRAHAVRPVVERRVGGVQRDGAEGHVGARSRARGIASLRRSHRDDMAVGLHSGRGDAAGVGHRIERRADAAVPRERLTCVETAEARPGRVLDRHLRVVEVRLHRRNRRGAPGPTAAHLRADRDQPDPPRALDAPLRGGDRAQPRAAPRRLPAVEDRSAIGVEADPPAPAGAGEPSVEVRADDRRSLRSGEPELRVAAAGHDAPAGRRAGDHHPAAGLAAARALHRGAHRLPGARRPGGVHPARRHVARGHRVRPGARGGRDGETEEDRERERGKEPEEEGPAVRRGKAHRVSRFLSRGGMRATTPPWSERRTAALHERTLI